MHFLSKLETPAYAALRIIAGLLFAVHGTQKIFGWLAEQGQPAVGSQVWIGGLIELVGGVLLAIGLGTRLVAFICSGTMAVAYIQFHWKGALGGFQWLPSVNGGELAVVYCFLFLFIATRGAGALSIDGARQRA